jgi:hypothetical protein
MHHNPASASDIKKQIKKLKSQKKGFNSEKERYRRLYKQYKTSNPSQASVYLQKVNEFKQKAAAHQTRIEALQAKLKAIQRYKKGLTGADARRGMVSGFVSGKTSSTTAGTRGYFSSGSRRGMVSAVMTGEEAAQGQTVPSSGDLSLADEAMSIEAYGPSSPSAAAVAAEDGSLLGDDEEKTPYGRYALAHDVSAQFALIPRCRNRHHHRR